MSVKIDNCVIDCVTDSGATVCVMPRSVFEGSPWLPSIIRLKAYGGTSLPVVGQRKCAVSYRGKTVEALFVGIDAPNEKPLLTLSLCRDLGIFDDLCATDRVNLVLQDDAFEGLGCVKGVEYSVSVKDTAVPRACCPRRHPPAVLDKIEQQLNIMLKDGVIVPAEPSLWCSPTVPVVKKNGELRLCTDFRYLNESINREPFLIPSLEDLLTRLSGATVFGMVRG